MYRIWLLALMAAWLPAQQATTHRTPAKNAAPHGTDPDAAQTQATKPEDLCSIQGQVVNAQSGEPLGKASLILTRIDVTPGNNNSSTVYSTTSDSGGNFLIKDIEPGQYRLMPNRNGFVALQYGAGGPARVATPLSLARGQQLTQLTLKMTPHGVITGRVVDGDGEPVVNARISLQSYRFVQGRKQLMNSGGGATTNDLGEYRAFGVAPGKYYLSASAMGTGQMYIADRLAGPEAEEDYVPTFYPGTIDPSAAAPLEVAAGAQLRGIDLRLLKTRTVHVKGRVTHGLPGRPNLQVFLTPRTAVGMMGGQRSNRVDPAGNFDIRGITPGQYNLTALVNEGNTSRQAHIPLDVGSSNIEGLTVAIGPGIAIKGHLRAEGNDSGPVVDLRNVRLNLQPREPGVMFFGPGQGKPNDDGFFEISNLPPDRYNFFISGLPKGAYVKTIRTEQADVLASGLDVTGGAAPNLVEIVISPRAAAVTGTVQNANTGNPAPGATVVLIPQEDSRRDQMSFYKIMSSDQNGAFALQSVPPGRYKAFAWEDLEAGAYMDPEVIKPVEEKGETLVLQEGDQKTVNLKLLPAAGK